MRANWGGGGPPIGLGVKGAGSRIPRGGGGVHDAAAAVFPIVGLPYPPPL